MSCLPACLDKLDITDISHNNYLDTSFGKGVQQHQRTCAVCVDYQQNIIMQNVIMNHWRASCPVTFEDVTYTMYSTQHSKYFFCCLMAGVEQKSTTIPPRSLFQSKLHERPETGRCLAQTESHTSFERKMPRAETTAIHIKL